LSYIKKLKIAKISMKLNDCIWYYKWQCNIKQHDTLQTTATMTRMPNAPMISAPFASVGPDRFPKIMSFDYSRMTVCVNECFCQAFFMYINYFKQIQYISYISNKLPKGSSVVGWSQEVLKSVRNCHCSVWLHTAMTSVPPLHV